MERFVLAIVAGGIALVAGLWIVALVSSSDRLWFLGIGLVLVGAGGLGWGIWSEVSMGRLFDPGGP